jgi:hypothetical protein
MVLLMKEKAIMAATYQIIEPACEANQSRPKADVVAIRLKTKFTVPGIASLADLCS